MRTFKPNQFIHAKLTELLLHTQTLNIYMYKLDPVFNFEILNKLRQKTKRNEKWKNFKLTWTTLRFLLWSKPTWLVFLDRQAPNTEGRVEQPWKCASPERSLPGPQSKQWSQSRNTPGWPCLSCCCQRKDDEKMCPACILPSVQRKYGWDNTCSSFKVHLTLKYFFRSNKSLHRFETHYAFLPLFNPNLDFSRAIKVTKSGHHLSQDRASKGSIPCLTSQTPLHACLHRLNTMQISLWHQTRNRPMPLTSSVVWQMMARFYNFYNLKKCQDFV